MGHLPRASYVLRQDTISSYEDHNTFTCHPSVEATMDLFRGLPFLDIGDIS
jgi:hypothetical protein